MLFKLLKALWHRMYKLNLIHGLYFVPVGIAGLYAAYYSLQHVVQIAAIGGFLWLTIEGIRRIVRNPVDEAIALDQAKADHLASQQAATSVSAKK